MLRSAMRQPKALPALIAISTAASFSAGRAPGSPRQTMQTCVLGGAPKRVGQPQKIFDRVRSCAWTSSPITGSKSETGMLAALHDGRGPVLGRLGGAGDAQQRLLFERLSDQLQPDRQALGVEAGGNGDPWQARQVGRDRVDVVQVHGERIVHLLAQPEGGGRA